MKKSCISALSGFMAVLVSFPLAARGQEVAGTSMNLAAHAVTDGTVLFGVEDEGVSLPIIWGLDTAWPSAENINRGVAFIGKEHLGIARASFQPSDLVVDGELSSAQKRDLDNRLALVRQSGVTTITLNCDHEVLVDPEDGTEAELAAAAQHRANYQGKPEEWAKLIEATTRYCQSKGFTVVSVAPFNEPDYTPWNEGTLEDFYNIAKLLKENPLFADIRICGGNTLNCDQALPWYNGLKEYLDEGNTHQLAGSFDNYAAFFETVRADGKHATADELHNVMEAMVGVEYGMQTGIWWGFDGRARGEFCKASSGERLGYAEDRGSWSAAAVYRNNEEGKVQAFLGTSERQATTSTYRFVSKDRDVYFDGYGPAREFVVEMPGGTGYQNGQTNAERVVDITWGEDVPPYINGNYMVMNAHSGKLLSLVGAKAAEGSNLMQKANKGADYQQWSVVPVDSRIGGDFSYYTITTIHSSGYTLDVLNWSLSTANIIAYSPSYGNNQQWYLQYAGNGFFYIRSRHSNLCLEVAGTGLVEGARVQQNTFSGEAKQQWHFVPVGAKCEMEAPQAPVGLEAYSQPASVRLEWTANAEEDLDSYAVLRAEHPLEAGADTLFNTIGRGVVGTAFVDNSVEQGVGYIYKVKAMDKSGNLSAASQEVEASTNGEKTLVAKWQFDDNTDDETVNMQHGAFCGTPTYVGIKKSGDKSLMLNGTDQYVRLPYQVGNMREMTLCTWMRCRSNTAWQRVFDFGNGTDQYMFLTPNGGGGMRFVMKNGGEEEILATEPAPQNSWIHVAVTLSNEAVVLYLNGEEVARSTTMTIRPSDIRPVMNYIGRSQYSADPMLKAYVDDFRIYNYPLSSLEIQGVMEDLASSIHEIVPEEGAEVISVEYYTPNGIRTSSPTKGMNIVRRTYSDGHVETDKVVVK